MLTADHVVAFGDLAERVAHGGWPDVEARLPWFSALGATETAATGLDDDRSSGEVVIEGWPRAWRWRGFAGQVAQLTHHELLADHSLDDVVRGVVEPLTAHWGEPDAERDARAAEFSWRLGGCRPRVWVDRELGTYAVELLADNYGDLVRTWG